jgi:hypothetical protein
MTLADGTLLELTNDQIWEGGITIDEATSSDSSFDIGSAVIGSLQIVIDNITGNFSQYDFFDASLVLWLGVDGDVDSGDNQRYYRKGFYVVDKPSYNGSLITLECLDNMTWFDAPFEEVTGITYPANAGTVVQAICQYVGVTLGTPAFPNYADPWTQILAAPEQQLSCREVIQYIAQMCCCYCKINTAGQLVLNWYNKQEIIGITNYDGGTYNTTTTPYSDGCDLDGGHFMYGGDSADGGTFQDLLDTVWISNNFQIEVSTDGVVVTGCRVRNNASKESAYDVIWTDPTVEADHDRYVLVIDSNPFIVSEEKASHIANIVGSTLAGLPIRGFTATSLSDFSYETGDMATIVDFRGNRYYSWITSFTFTTNISENFSCGVQSLKQRSEQRFSTIAETYEKAKVALTAYDKAVKAMNELANNSIDFTEYVYPVGAQVSDPRTVYRYNGTTIDTTDPTKPKFPNSTVVVKIAGDGVFVSNSKDDQGYEIYDNGYDANSGTAILELLYARGIEADWIRANAITANKIAANAVTANKIAASAVTADKISVTNLQSISAIIGGWSIDNNGLTNHDDAWVKPTLISCGQYGGTLIAMRGGSSGDSSGYLEVGVNAASDYIHVHYNYISRSDGKYAYFTEGSDRRLKKNIKELSVDEARLIIDNSKPVSFRYKAHDEIKQYGFIAQDVDAQCEELGLENPFVKNNERGDGMKVVDYEQYITPLIKVVQDQQEQIDLLKQELADLKAKVK